MKLANADVYSKVLSKCTNEILKNVVITCGFKATAAKKDERVTSIINGLTLTSRLPRRFNVIGVDIGLKNFAYCKYTVDFASSAPPEIAEWNKFDLHKRYLPAYAGVLPTAYTRDNILAENIVDSTRYLSFLAHRVVSEVLFPPPHATPSVVIIEHQRSRSVGQSSTLPNVMNNIFLEYMIYSSFYTYQQQQQQQQQQRGIARSMINPVYSQSMAHFWINRYVQELTDNNKIYLAKHSKSMRNKLVFHWMNRWIGQLHGADAAGRAPPPFTLNAQVTAAVRADATYQAKPFIKYANKPSKLLSILAIDETFVTNFKIDDLVDSLLHGLSYIKYHQNKLKLLAVLDECVEDEKHAREKIVAYLDETRDEQLALLDDLIGETNPAPAKPPPAPAKAPARATRKKAALATPGPSPAS